MTDELPQRKSIGNVQHVRIEVSEIAAQRRIYAVPTVNCRHSYNGTIQDILPAEYRTDIESLTQCLSWARQHAGLSDIWSIAESNIASGGRSDDRRHELSSKLMDRLQGLHLANTLYEARELPALWKMFSRRQALGSFFNRAYQYYRSRNNNMSRNQWLTSLFRAYRQGFLAWTFGIMPTIGDMKAINDELRNRRPRKRSTVVTVTDTHAVNRNGTNSGGVQYGRRSYTINEERFRVFGLRGTTVPPENKYLTDFFASLQTGIDQYIGLNPAALIWEAIPFSFAIDWLLSVDKCLDALWLSQSGIETQYWSSTKITADRKFQYQNLMQWEARGVPLNVFTPNRIAYSDHEHTEKYSGYYRVRAVAPSPFSTLGPRGNKPKQLFLAFLIAIGIVRR